MLIDLIFVAEMRDFFHIVSPSVRPRSERERDITDDNVIEWMISTLFRAL